MCFNHKIDRNIKFVTDISNLSTRAAETGQLGAQTAGQLGLQLANLEAQLVNWDSQTIAGQLGLQLGKDKTPNIFGHCLVESLCWGPIAMHCYSHIFSG